jgi:hypothetical protein
VSFSGGGSFGSYLLYGGLNLSSSTLTLGGGELVLVGGGTLGSNGDLNTNNQAFIDGGTGAGDLIILTGSSSSFSMNGSGTGVTGNANNDLYPGLSTQINSNPLLVTAAQGGNLAFGPASLLSGADSASAAVKGLDPTQVPSSPGYDLTPFGGLVLWQDQANSAVRYTTPSDTPSPLQGSGYIDSYNCGAGHSINNPCTNNLANPNSPAMTFQANPTLGLTGIFYQPRGAWLSTQGGPGAGIQGAIQIITGAIFMQGHGTISTTPPPIPLKRRVVSLIE